MAEPAARWHVGQGARVGEAAADAELVAWAKQDRQAFAPLYRRHVEPIHRYCYRRLGERAAAEDATSLVFAKALASLPSYRAGAGSFQSWLFAIAHHVIADDLRATRPAASLADAWDVADAAPSPAELAFAAEERRSVRDLLVARRRSRDHQPDHAEQP